MLIATLSFLLLFLSTASGESSQLRTRPLLAPPLPLVATPTPVQEVHPYGAGLFGPTIFKRKPFKDIAFMGKTVLTDGVWLYTSPTRINRRSALLLGGIVAVGAGLYMLDDEIYDGLRRSSEHWLYSPIEELGEIIEPVGRQAVMNKYVFGTAVVSYMIGFERLAKMSSELLESYLLAGGFKVATNKIAGRPRPNDGFDADHWHALGKGQSFFSGHASHAFQMARVFSHNIDFWPLQVCFYGAATSVGLQRISSGWHWSSDVWIGSVYGYIVADALLKRHDRQWFGVQPMSSRDGSAHGLQLTFRF